MVYHPDESWLPEPECESGVAIYNLSENFAAFFSRLNPSDTFTAIGASEHTSIRDLIEDPNGPSADLNPKTFLQGSYKQSTAIDKINDVDIVVLCQALSIGGGNGVGSRNWSRDQIFDTIAAPLRANATYRNKLRYGPGSMCIKVDLAIKIEILPVVFKAGVTNPEYEPFALYRPASMQWEDGFARYHQWYLTDKNKRTDNNFVPMVKVLKHLRSYWQVKAVSFHLECLLYSLPDELFIGAPADYIPAVLDALARNRTLVSAIVGLRTPCNDRNILESEWAYGDFATFHDFVELWAAKARAAAGFLDYENAVSKWQELFGAAYFPVYMELGGLGFGGLGSL